LFHIALRILIIILVSEARILHALLLVIEIRLQAFAQALLVVPKTLAENSGFDVQDSLIRVQEEQERSETAAGLDLSLGEPFLPAAEGVWDSVSVKRQSLNLSTVLATQLLLVDEVMKAGKSMGKASGPAEDE